MVNIERGQLWHSEDTLAERWKRSRGKVRRFLEYLETIQQIVQHKSKVKSIISIINYEKYQWNDTTNSTTNGHQTVQQTDTNKNNKNNKNDKEDLFDLFRAEYPRKLDKAKAKSVYDKVIRAWADPQVIIAWAKQYTLAKVWTDKEFIKHPTTRLNWKNREDELEINTTKAYELYIADGRPKEIKRTEYCSKYSESIMKQAQAEYQAKQRQWFTL